MKSIPSPANAGSTMGAGHVTKDGDKARHVQRKPRPPLHSWPLGAASLLVLALNTLFWCLLMFPFALLKLALPMPGARRRIDPILNGIARAWITCNGAWFGAIQRHAWDVDGLAGLKRSDWYLVNCNHQSWVDIFVLQRALNGRVPLLKFFLKQQLLYVPVIGLAWWALDFPFMKRHTRAQLRRKPQLRREDQDTARRACEKFSLSPTSVMVFAEGTRFTEAKRVAEASPYRHLLKPKAGGLAVTINAMGNRFRAMLDATIVYPHGAPTFWQFACGRTGPLIVRVHQLPIPPAFCNADYGTDSAFRSEFHRWLAQQWEDKDTEIDRLLTQAAEH